LANFLTAPGPSISFQINLQAGTFTFFVKIMGFEREGQGWVQGLAWILNTFAKKVVFLVSSRKKQILPLLVLAKKVVFLVSSRKKQILPLLVPLYKNF